MRREADYLHWLKRRAIENEWDPAIRCEEVSETELLRQATNDTRLGVVNEWGSFTDPEFVSKAMLRAESLVKDSDRYRATLMR